jgi:hypothetical protein
MRVSLLACLGLVMAVGAAPAQPGPRLVKLTLTPAAAPTPALKYHLLPRVGELRAGNGAVYYERAGTNEWGGVLRQKEFAQLHELLDQPMTKELAAKLAPFASTHLLRELDQGARCDYVDWQMTRRIREESFFLLLPDMQTMRSVAVLLAARIRLDIHEGKFDKAMYSLQTGLALGRDIAQTPTLISDLVGLAITNVMLTRVEELIQQPGMASLYWACTDLPNPLVDMRRGMEGERISVHELFPSCTRAVAELDMSPVPPAELRKGVETLHRLDSGLTPAACAALAALVYPHGRTYFLARGCSEKELDALPVTQVAIMFELAEYERWMDAYCKLYPLPYWQARPLYAKVEQELRATRRTVGHGLMLTQQLLPALQNVVRAQVRMQRRVALLRVVEALRLHAAANDGRLPDALEDVHDVPLPVDPATGVMFRYQRTAADRATLEAPPPPGEQANEGNAARYEIALREKPQSSASK